ncbi:DUF2911 domain-containing protein [Salinimicrobium sp. MT39]|jgi:hypothetical protein|uniref:DUF2911 domain-containing protein n=1 Tax=Salinimicrobium profundisediminis TaxID=2994553 RepID=A0A9X3CZQ6_9FLAO|nr:DUF2911 domain-containing protein [Salinimicrobium profundisediminis]MCX2839680.1 DUF2911 domain-containing protein [Salinimicrobium profundisediminis]
MKKYFIMFAVMAGSLTTQLYAQDTTETLKDNDGPNFSKLDVSPMDVALFRGENNEPMARVLYSRPQTRDREVFGKLVPFGEVWRTGANEATEITLYQDLMVANKTIKKGTYTLFTIPKENEWTIILNNSTNIWGAYDYHVEKDVARITVPVRKSPVPIEALSMSFAESNDGANLFIGWDDRYVQIPFKQPK